MAKKRHSKTANEKLFLKQLQDYAKKSTTFPKETRKASVKTKRNTATGKDSSKQSKRQTDIFKETQLRKEKSVRKNLDKNKIPIQTQRSGRSGKGTKQKAGKYTGNKPQKNKGTLTTEKQSRKNWKQIDFGFSKVRSIDKKINLFESNADKALSNQLRKRGGKPPRGIVVVVTDKKGNTAGASSPLDFVVNSSNVKKFTTKFLRELGTSYKAYKYVKKTEDKESADDSGYGNYNPDNIESITIKFIY